jgi:hypothetical protein
MPRLPEKSRKERLVSEKMFVRTNKIERGSVAMYRKILSMRRGILVLTAVFAMSGASIFTDLADAHMYFSFPADNNPGAGETDVFTSFALSPPNADESGEGAVRYDIAGWVVSSNNPASKTPAAFAFTDDSRRSRVSVPGGATSVFVTSADYANDELYEGVTYHQEFACYSKAFINLGEDGFSTRSFLTRGLEIVPLSDLASLTPSSAVRLKVLKDGSPLANANVYATQEGAPFTDLHDEVTALRVNETGDDGVVEFIMPSSTGKTYFYAMYLDSRTTDTGFYGMMSSLSFEISAPFAGSATDLLVRAENRGTNMEFVGAGTYAALRDALSMLGLLDLVSEPTGTISGVSGRAGQIGNIGAAFRVPMDVTGARNAEGAALKGTTGSEQRVNFSRELLGDETFGKMTAFLREVRAEKGENPQYENTERGEFYVAPTPKDFLDQFGISVMGSFSGGEAVEVGHILQLGIELAEADFEAGNIFGLLGGMFTDSAPVDGSDWFDATETFVGPDPHYRFAIIYDGAHDNALDFAYWVTGDTKSGGSGGGCNAGALGAAGLCLIAAAAARKRLFRALGI